MPTETEKAAAVISALRGLMPGDTVQVREDVGAPFARLIGRVKKISRFGDTLFFDVDINVYGMTQATTSTSCNLSKRLRAAAVIEALRSLQLGDEVNIVAHDYLFCEITGYVVGFSDYTGSIQVMTSEGALWFQRNELRLV